MRLEPVTVTCPYCWESIETTVDTSALPVELTEDCSVCCQPIVLSAACDFDGRMRVDASRENG